MEEKLKLIKENLDCVLVVTNDKKLKIKCLKTNITGKEDRKISVQIKTSFSKMKYFLNKLEQNSN